MSRRPWTDDEDAFLVSNPRMSAARAAVHLRRTKSAVDNRRRKLSRQYGVDFSASRDRFEINPYTPGSRRITTPAYAVGRRRLVARTCVDCDRLLDGSWYIRESETWSPRCKTCISEQREGNSRTRNPDVLRRQEAVRRELVRQTQDGAARRHYTWTSEELAALEDDRRTLADIAQSLGRSLPAVLSKRRKLGLPDRRRLGEPAIWVIRAENGDESLYADGAA